MLLILDGYLRHMTYKYLLRLEAGSIIVYALPSHTSCVTQPLDVGVFSVFKENLRNLVDDMSVFDKENNYGLFDFL